MSFAETCHISWDRVCLWLHPSHLDPNPNHQPLRASAARAHVAHVTDDDDGSTRDSCRPRDPPPNPMDHFRDPPPSPAVQEIREPPIARRNTTTLISVSLAICGEDRNGTRDTIYDDIYFIRIWIWI